MSGTERESCIPIFDLTSGGSGMVANGSKRAAALLSWLLAALLVTSGKIYWSSCSCQRRWSQAHVAGPRACTIDRPKPLGPRKSLHPVGDRRRWFPLCKEHYGRPICASFAGSLQRRRMVLHKCLHRLQQHPGEPLCALFSINMRILLVWTGSGPHSLFQ